jgi:hypothetical protein
MTRITQSFCLKNGKLKKKQNLVLENSKLAKGNYKANTTFEKLKKMIGTLTTRNRYVQGVVFPFKVMLRLSITPRRKNAILDIDIVSIGVVDGAKHMKRNGFGTRFFKEAIKVAGLFNKGIYLEQAITNGSRGLGKKLVKLGIATEFEKYNFLSRFDSNLNNCKIRNTTDVMKILNSLCDSTHSMCYTSTNTKRSIVLGSVCKDTLNEINKCVNSR